MISLSSLSDFKFTDTAWCKGCGNFGIRRSLAGALSELDLEPHQVLVCSGIGQAAKMPHYLRVNALNVLHGRALPTAIGAKLANPQLTVIAEGGDGDGYAEGGNHFLHALRKNVDMTYLVHDNRVFALTKGQASPTTEPGRVTGYEPEGHRLCEFNPLTLAISLEAGFVARGYSADIDHLTWLIKEAVSYKGFSFIDILQPCVSFNKVNTYKWYGERVYQLEGGKGFGPSEAMERAQEWGERIPIGVFYRGNRSVYGPSGSDSKEPSKPEADRRDLVLSEFRLG